MGATESGISPYNTDMELLKCGPITLTGEYYSS